MMPTVSLRARVISTGVAVVAIVMLGLDAFVYLSLRDRLLGSLEDVLENRASLARRLGSTVSAPELARLAGSGVHITVRSPDGRVLAAEPDADPEDGPPPTPQHALIRHVTLPAGEVVELSISSVRADQTLRRLMVWEAAGTPAALAIAAWLLARTARIALRPLDRVVETARRIGAGRSGERLNPGRTDTELGRMNHARPARARACPRPLDARVLESQPLKSWIASLAADPNGTSQIVSQDCLSITGRRSESQVSGLI